MLWSCHLKLIIGIFNNEGKPWVLYILKNILKLIQQSNFDSMILQLFDTHMDQYLLINVCCLDQTVLFDIEFILQYNTNITRKSIKKTSNQTLIIIYFWMDSQLPSNHNSQLPILPTQEDIIQQISQSIKSIKSNLSKPNEHQDMFPVPSISSNLFIASDLTAIHHKRDNPVQIFPSLIKKRKRQETHQKYQQGDQQGYEESSIPQGLADEVDNRRITDFFGSKNQERKNPQTPLKIVNQDSEKNPAIKILKQKIIKKKKAVQDLKSGINRLKEKNQQFLSQFLQFKQKQQKFMIQFLLESYRLKIYSYGKQQIQHSFQEERLYERNKNIEEIINTFKTSKTLSNKNKKTKKENGSDEESNTYLDFYLKDRTYLDKWVKILQIDQQKMAIMSDFHKYTNSHQRTPFLNNTFYYQLPSIVLQYSSQHYSSNNIILDNNLALCSLNNNSDQCYYQILTFNLDTLKYQQLNIIKYPTFMSSQRKQQLLSLILNSIKRYRMLINISNVLHQTIAQQFNSGYIMISHDYFENSNSLQHLLMKYESLPQQICKHIIKFCLKVLHDVKTTTDMDWIVSTRRILINSNKYDLKIVGNCEWELYSFGEYRNMISKNKQYLYYSPEILKEQYPNSLKLLASSTMWSIGILFYELLTGKKPFDYEIVNNIKPQEFYLLTSVTYPPKASACKEFISSCLSNPSERISLVNALKHPYFAHK